MSEQLPSVLTRFLLAVQFLTLLPVRIRTGFCAAELPRSAVFFPLVGALQGLFTAGVAYGAGLLFAPDITGAFVVLILIFSNGGLHVDGLADTFDALALKSSGDREADRAKRLAIMKESTVGAIGAIAIVMNILIKYLLISHLLLHVPSFAPYAVLVIAACCSKWTMVPAAYHGRAARQDGIGRLFIGTIRTGDLFLSSVMALFLALAVAETAPQAPGWFLVAAFLLPTGLVLYLFSYGARRFFTSRFGGLTGDTLGAIGELSELLCLTAGYLWLQRSI